MLAQHRNRFALILVALGAMVLLAACGGGQTETAETPQPAAEVQWAYDGEAGPEHWGELSPEFALCSTGQEQTPIDLANAERENAPDVTFNYQAAPLEVLNNGHTIQVASDNSSSITIDDSDYSLAQFHFHTPSEHTVDGDPYAAELHLVHQDEDNQLAVVGVLINEGAENPAFAPIIANLPAEVDQQNNPEGVTFNPLVVLPESHLAFQYSGSLTTPPCSEGVDWYVMTTPVEMSAAQLEALQTVMGDNSRPVQPLNGRDVREDVSSD